MKRNLSKIASTRFGVHAKAMDHGPMVLVPASAIGVRGDIVPSHLRRIAPHLVRCQPVDHLIEGDVLLVGKGNVNHAAVWPGGQEDALASNTLFVIRPDPEQLLPGYLAGYLNSSTAQAWFTTHRKTGTVHVLGRAALDQLPVPVPPIDVQRQMVKLSVATGQMIDVYNELAQAYSTLLNSAWAQLNEQ